ncbi:hypothetical protein Q604_UNBC04599G0001, partial [human gut metagenome]
MSIDTAIIYGKANKSKYKLNLNTEKALTQGKYWVIIKARKAVKREEVIEWLLIMTILGYSLKKIMGQSISLQSL